MNRLEVVEIFTRVFREQVSQYLTIYTVSLFQTGRQRPTPSYGTSSVRPTIKSIACLKRETKTAKFWWHTVLGGRETLNQRKFPAIQLWTVGNCTSSIGRLLDKINLLHGYQSGEVLEFDNSEIQQETQDVCLVTTMWVSSLLLTEDSWISDKHSQLYYVEWGKTKFFS